MDILKLFIVFCVIILVMWLKKPISIAVLAATVVTILIYRLPIAAACSAMVKGATSWTTIEALLSFTRLRSFNGCWKSGKICATVRWR